MSQNTKVVGWQYRNLDLNVGDMFAILQRWKWVVTACAVSGAVVAGVWSYRQTPVFRATASVVVEREEAASLERGGNYFLIPEYYQTHFELLKSPGVLQKAAERIDLASHAEYRRRPPSQFQELLARVMPKIGQSDVGEQEEAVQDGADIEGAPRIDQRLLKMFSDHVEVKPVRGTRVAYVSVESQDPVFAAKAANAVTASYIESWIAVSARSKEKASEWYEAQLERLRGKVEEAEKGLYAYRVKHGMVDARDGERDVGHRLAELNNELIRAEMKLAEAQTRYQHVSSIIKSTERSTGIDWKLLDSSSEVLASSLIQTLRAQEIKASSEVAELADKYGPLHPKLTHAKSELAELRERIRQEVEKVYTSLKHEHDLALAKVRVVQDAVAKQKVEKAKLEQREIEYGILDREAKSTRLLYEMFLKKMKDRELSPESQYTPVYLADPAVPMPFPIKPRKKLNMVIGLMTGLISGVGIGLFFELRDRRFRGTEDVQRYLSTLPILGVVPRLPKGETQQLSFADCNGSRGAAEAFRSLRTTLLLSSLRDRSRSLLITSPGKREGKTTVAANLATTMAQLEHVKVVLINADLRQPELHPVYQLKKANGDAKGLRHFLVGQADFQSIIHSTEIPNLWIVPQGGISTNPSELVHSRSMAMLLARCHEQGWHIIIDSPEVLSVAEGLILSTMVEGVLLVVSAPETSREASRVAAERLLRSGARLLGVVVQKASARELAVCGPMTNGHDPGPNGGLASKSSALLDTRV